MVTDYLYAAELANIINGKAPLSTLINWGPAMGFLPHQQALVFIDSHDGQRDRKLLGANQLISYKQPRKYIIATAFMLAHPYGRVKRIMSSYYFAAQQPEQGPPYNEGEEPEADVEVEVNEAEEVNVEPAQSDEETIEGDDGTAEEDNVAEAVENEATEGEEDATNVVSSSSHIRSPTFDATTGRCEYNSGWVCEHRWPPIVQMIQLVNTLSELEDGVINFQTDGPNHIAFCRGNKAFFAFNSDLRLTYDADVETCLPSGTYCDVISGGRAEYGVSTKECVGKHVAVDAEGRAHILVPAMLGVDEEDAAVGSDYDETDVDTNDAYGVAVGTEGEFGMLAIYQGSRLENEAQTDSGGQITPSVGEDETVTELVVENDEEDSADAEIVTEIVDGTKEIMSAEELEDVVVETEKNAKLEEAATDASVENGNAEDETSAVDAAAAAEIAEEQINEPEGVEQPTIDDEEPTPDYDTPKMDEVPTEPIDEIEKPAAVEPAATEDNNSEIEESNTEHTSEELAVDHTESEDVANDDDTLDDNDSDQTTGAEANVVHAAPNITGLRVGLVNIEKVVQESEQNAQDDSGSGIMTGLKDMTDSVVEKTKEVSAQLYYFISSGNFKLLTSSCCSQRAIAKVK